MIGKKELIEFASLGGKGFPVTTLLLKLSPTGWGKRELGLRTKDLIKSIRPELPKKFHLKQEINSVLSDFEAILGFLEDGFPRLGTEKGVLIFSSSGSGLFKFVPLFFDVEEKLYVEGGPVLKDLVFALANHRHFMTILVDRERARFFDIFLDNAQEFEPILDEIPRKAKVGGSYGLEKRIEGHYRDATKRHLKNVNTHLEELSKDKGFDWIVLGGHSERLGEVAASLSPGLKKKVAGSFHAEPKSCDIGTVLRETKRFESQIEEKEKRVQTERIFGSFKVGGAVLGFENTLTALNRDEVHTLFVTKGETRKGRFCERCQKVYEKETVCSTCESETRDTHDITEAIIRFSLRKGVSVECLPAGSSLEKSGGFAGILKFGK